jgi:Flp pilus assembly protein protease CpaA
LAKPSDLLAIATIVAGTGTGAAIDMWTRRVPNPLTMGLAATGVVYAACGIGNLSLGASLAGLALGLALMLPGHLIGATGAGDVKLFAAAGAFVGPAHILTAFIYTALAGGAIAIVISLARRPCADVGDTALLIATVGMNASAIESPLENNRSHTPRPSPSARCWLRWDSENCVNEGPDLWLACVYSWCSCWQ